MFVSTIRRSDESFGKKIPHVTITNDEQIPVSSVIFILVRFSLRSFIVLVVAQ